MNYNILTGGAAGQGMDTLAAILEKLLKRKGFHILTVRDYMSRIRGGHNFVQTRFGNERIYSHWDELDAIIALNDETLELHMKRLRGDGFAISDEDSAYNDPRIMRLPLKKYARELGNARVSNTIALGAVLGVFGIEPVGIYDIFRLYFSEDASKINLAAIEKGISLADKRYEVIPESSDENILINGNDAVALGALAAGCKFYSAYPMTPSTSIMNYLASKMLDAEIVVEQAEDEIAAINMAIGASFAGARAMTGTSGGGFSLMVEALGLSGMMEVPLVIAEVQRPGPVTGLPTRTEQSDLKFVISASHGEFPRMVIALRNPEDAFRQTIRAFDLADRYGLPVILLSDQYLADTSITTEPFKYNEIKFEREIPGRREGFTITADSDEHDESGHITESADVRVCQMDKRLGKLELLKQELEEPEYIGASECDTLLLAWGSLWGPVKEAVEKLNSDNKGKYGALVFGDVWPLPTGLLKEKAHYAARLINVEQNATGQLASVIAETTGLMCHAGVLKYDGRQMNAQYIYSKVKESEGASVQL